MPIWHNLFRFATTWILISAFLASGTGRAHPGFSPCRPYRAATNPFTLADTMTQPASRFRFPADRFGLALTAALLLFGSPPARAEKPLPGIDASWSLMAPARAGAEMDAVLRIQAAIPVRHLEVEMPGPAADPLVVQAFPRYAGTPEPGTPLELRARVRIPRGSGSVDAVIRADTPGGPLVVHARLDLTPAGFAPAGYREARDRTGTPLRVWTGTAAAGAPGAGSPARAAGVFSGRFLYRDRVFGPQGFLHATAAEDPVLPVRFALVELLEDDVPVATGTTDTAGAFAFSFTPSGGAAYQVRVESHTGTWPGPALQVTVSGSNPTLYAAVTGSVTGPGGDVDLGDTVIEPGSGGEAFNILDQALDGVRFTATLAATPPSAALRLAWNPSAGWTTGFVRSGVIINLDKDEAYDDCVVLHEFGHYAMWHYSTDESPGGLHYINVSDQDPRLSWSEGFASFFQSAVRAWRGDPYPSWYVDTYGTPGAGQLFFSFEAEGPSYHVYGIGSELVVDALLWDLVDGPGTPGDGRPGDDDPLELPVQLVWDTVAGPMKTASTITLEDFWDGWFDPSVNGDHRADLETTFAALGVEYFPDAYENDAAGTPLIPDGSTQHHTFYPAGDLEPFTLDLQAGDAVTVETLNILNYGDTYLEVLDSRGAPVGSSDDRSPGDPSSAVSFTAAAADTYLVHVTRAFGGDYSQYTVYGSYDIRAVPGIPGPAPLAEIPGGGGTDDSQAGAGAAFADYDRDGLADLYLVNNTVVGAAYAKDVLFRNRGDRTFSQVTAAAGLGNPEGGIAVAWGDYDNDGDPDLFVSDHGLYRNRGDGRFTDVTASSGVVDIGREFDAAWVDADGDGRLDLFVVRRDGPSALWHNQGDGTFTDVAPDAGFGFAPSPGEDAYSCAWGDADGDGRPDLFMTYASTRGQRLFRNLGNNRFTDVTAASGLVSTEPATGGVWGDVNNDGALDLFVAATGPNRLYLNRGDGTFDDRSGDYGVDDPGTAEGAGFADLDLDGDLDLYVVNLDGGGRLYENLGVTMLRIPGADDVGLGFGCAWGDIDNDGDPDLYLSRGCATACQPNVLYENHAGDGAVPWLKVRLWGNASNRDGLGAQIRLYAGGAVQVRERGTGCGWGGKSLLPEAFGWPAGSAAPDSVEVFWPSGVRDVVRNPAPDRVLVVGEGEGEITLPEPLPSALRLEPPYPNPFAGGTTLFFTLAEAAPVRVEILDVSGRRVRLLLDEPLPPGTYDAGWDGRDARGRSAAAGVYFFRLQAGADRAVRKLVRLGD